MNLKGSYDWHIPQRQATAGLLIALYKTVFTVIKNAWVFILVLIFGQGKRSTDYVQYILIAIAVLVLVQSIIEFFYFRFFIADDELIIKKGLIRKKNITIPIEKIQAVHIEQSLLHQALEIVKVKIDTAGSEKTEAVIDAISARKAEQFKNFLLQEKQQLGGETQDATTVSEKHLVQLGARDLVKLGLSANHIQAFFIVLATLVSLYENLREAFGDQLLRTAEESSVTKALLASIPLLVVLVMFVSVVVSMVRILLKYYGFALSETPLAYKLKSGLLNTKQFVVPFRRIQFVSWEANWIRRMIGLYIVEFHQVSGKQVNEKQRVRVPVTRKTFIEPLFLHYHEMIQETAHSTHKIHPVFAIRRMLMTGILPIIVIFPITQLAGWNAWFLLLFLWIPYKYVNAYFFRKNFRLFISPDAFQVNSGIWGREVRVMKWYKIQQVKLKQSIYQRRKKLATLKLYTAGGSVKIPFIPLELAQKIQNYALYEVERQHRPWI